MPYGLVPEQAADGCWAEAMRLVLAPSTAGDCSEVKGGGSDDGEEEGKAGGGGGGGGGGGVGANGSAAKTPLTLPGGVWDPVRTDCV